VASGIVTLSGASKIYILQRVFYVRILPVGVSWLFKSVGFYGMIFVYLYRRALALT